MMQVDNHSSVSIVHMDGISQDLDAWDVGNSIVKNEGKPRDDFLKISVQKLSKVSSLSKKLEGSVFKYKNGLSNDFVNRYLVLNNKKLLQYKNKITATAKPETPMLSINLDDIKSAKKFCIKPGQMKRENTNLYPFMFEVKLKNGFQIDKSVMMSEMQSSRNGSEFNFSNHQVSLANLSR